MHGCHTGRAKPALAPLIRRPIIDHRFFLCVGHGAWVSYQQSVTRAPTTHPRNRSSTIDSFYALLCHSAWVSPCHTSRVEPGLKTLSHSNRFSLCKPTKSVLGFTQRMRVTDNRFTLHILRNNTYAGENLSQNFQKIR